MTSTKNAPPWMKYIYDLKQSLAVKDRAAAGAAVTHLLDASAPIGQQWKGISELMRVSGELTLAHRAIDAFIAAAGNVPEAQYSKVVLNSQSGRLAEAHSLLSTLPAHVPDRAGHAYVMGNTAMTLGRVKEAREYLETAIKHRPGWGPAWLTLSAACNLANNPLGDQLIAEEKAAKRESPGDLARYYYAKGKLFIDCKNPDAAFAAFAKGAALLNSERGYSADANSAHAHLAMSGFDDGFIEKLNTQKKCSTARPIFVTGLPRSGTTLVEQILASHSDVKDGGELNITQHLAVETGGVSGCHLQSYIDRDNSPDDLAKLYLHLLSERFGENGRVVDKSIDMSRFMGLIASVLPDAPVIWMRRDPLDSAWSCFRTFFIHGVAWSYSLTDIAHHFRLEDMLLDYWQKRLGERILVVPYRDMVDAPENWTKRILKHCSLTEEDAVFKSHETERVVATASFMQVRRPINRDGLNVAEPFRKHLAPFIDDYYG